MTVGIGHKSMGWNLDLVVVHVVPGTQLVVTNDVGRANYEVNNRVNVEMKRADRARIEAGIAPNIVDGIAVSEHDAVGIATGKLDYHTTL